MSIAETRITTVIPTFGRPRLVTRAIRSVLSQSFRSFEVHVWDNASGDDTRAVVERLAREDPRVKYFAQPKNVGPWQNFQIGLEHVNTPYFNFLSDDDFLLPGFFEAAIERLERGSELTMFAGATVRLAPRFIIAPVLAWRDGIYSPSEALIEMARRGFPDWNAILFRKSVSERIGGLDVTFENAFDEEFICRYASTGSIAVSPSAFAVLTLHGGSQSSVRWSPAFHGSLRLAVHERLQRLPWLDDSSRAALAVLRQEIGREIFEKSVAAAVSDQPEKALDGAELLARQFRVSTRAAILRTLAGDNLFGVALRFNCNLALKLKRPLSYWINSRRYRQFTGLVNSALQVQ
jgi:glycosyltransferase involved in cell wall biosynthesis